MVDIGMDPGPIVDGCLAPTYYNVLNILDPSMAYDSSGKVVGVLRLPTDETNSKKSLNEYQNANEEPNPPENYDSPADSTSSRNSGKDIFQTPPKQGQYKLWVEDYLANNDIFISLSAGSGTIDATSESGQTKTLMQKQEPHPDVAEHYSPEVPQMENQEESNSPVLADVGTSNKERSVLELIEHCRKEEEKSTEYSGAEEKIVNPNHSWFASWNEDLPSKSWFGTWKHIPEPTPKPEPPNVAPALGPMPQMNEPEPARGCIENYDIVLADVGMSNQEKSTLELIEPGPKEEEKSMEYSGAEEKIGNPPSWFASGNQDPPNKSWSGIWEHAPEPTLMPNPTHQYKSDVAPALAPVLEMNEPEPARESIESYGTNTPLFKALARKDWHAVLFYLRTGSFSFNPLFGSTGMETVMQQVQTWVSKKDIIGNEMWRQLPLHGAICFGAPLIVIEHLLKAYPAAVRRPDVHGNLPLHLAYIFNADDITTAYLMRTFPQSIHMVNDDGMQPIQCSTEISSESFQSKAEFFEALSDYTRAIAENAPEKLIEQLQDVRRQLKAVNDTLFSFAPAREPEAIKEHISVLEESSSLVAFEPTAAFDGVGLGLCGVPLTQGKDTMRPAHTPTNGMKAEASKRDKPTEEKLKAEIPVAIPQVGCRVKEYCPATKTWREV